MYSTALRVAGFDIRESGDGWTALQQLDDTRPDCIVLDLMLPGLSGYAIRNELAASAEMKDIPIVVVTGTDVDSADLGTSCILKKPVAPDDVIAAVARCIAVHARRADRPEV